MQNHPQLAAVVLLLCAVATPAIIFCTHIFDGYPHPKVLFMLGICVPLAYLYYAIGWLRHVSTVSQNRRDISE